MSADNELSPERIRDAMENYIRFFNAGDLESLLGLYATDATVEDPVGAPIRKGQGELREFYSFAIGVGAKLVQLLPVRGSMAREAAIAFDVHLNLEGMSRVYQVIDVMQFDDQGKFKSMRAFWGPLNIVESS